MRGKGKVIGLITTRWLSTRLPGKALVDIGGKPLTQHIVDRLWQVKMMDKVVVATSVNSKPIVDYCKATHIPCIEHHLDHDYWGQICTGFLAYNPDIMIRAWGDCPLLQPDVINRMLSYSIENDFDYTYAIQLPKGYEVNIFTARAMKLAAHNMTARDKFRFNEISEHEALIRSGCNIGVWQSDLDPALQDQNFSVDTQADLERVREIYAKLTG